MRNRLLVHRWQYFLGTVVKEKRNRVGIGCKTGISSPNQVADNDIQVFFSQFLSGILFQIFRLGRKPNQNLVSLLASQGPQNIRVLLER